MKKMMIILAALFCVVTGCGKQAEDVGKTATSKSIETNTIKSGNTPTAKVSENVISKILQEGSHIASTIKRVYAYPSPKDEDREQLLEKKFRKGADSLISNEKNEEIKKIKFQLYNKDVPFRSNVVSLFENLNGDSLVNEDYISMEEWVELQNLYNSAQTKFVEDKKINIDIKNSNNNLIISSTTEATKYLNSLMIDLSSNKLTIGKEIYDYSTDKMNDGYEPIFHGKSEKVIIDGEELEIISTWAKEVDMSYSRIISLCKLKESNKLVIRYVFYDFVKNKFTEDIILINK